MQVWQGSRVVGMCDGACAVPHTHDPLDLGRFGGGSAVALNPSMPTQFPHQYRSTITRTFASRGRVEGTQRTPLMVGPSAQMDGDVATWSAENLLLTAIGTCLLSTFEAIAARDGIQLMYWQCTVSGQVEKTPNGLEFTSILAAIDMQIDGNVDNVEATLEDTKNYALVTSALRVPVIVEANVFDREHRQAV